MPMALVLLIVPSMCQLKTESVEPFKVGTFAIDDVPTVGLVLLDDQLIVEQEAEPRDGIVTQYSNMAMPEDMLGLIEQYEYGLKYRIYEVVWLVEENLLTRQPSDTFTVDTVDIMAFLYPSKIIT